VIEPTTRPIGDLRNIGDCSAQWLAEAGVATKRDLRRIGPVAAYTIVKANHPSSANLNLLWALQAAVVDMTLNELPDAVKAELKRELAS